MSYKRKQWTNLEIARLRKFYPVMSKDALLREFSPRSWESIRCRADELGIRRDLSLGGHKDWKAIAAEHASVFNLPTDVPIQHKRPWS